MTANRFIARKESVVPPHIILEGREHHHLSRVARVRKGDRVWVLDDEETTYLTEVMATSREETRLLILRTEKRQPPAVRLFLAQAVLKPKSMEAVIQKAAEFGASVVIPVIAARTIAKLGADEAKKVDRWNRICREAAKQSRSDRFTSVLSPVPLASFLEREGWARRLFLSEHGGDELKDHLDPGISEVDPVPSVVVLVGPEGGWEEEEEKQIARTGYRAVRLGKRVLRSETAAVACLAVLSHFWGL